MFSPNPKNDPLLSAIKGVIEVNDKHREAVDRANKHFKVTDKRQLPHNLHAQYEKMLSESVINEKITKSTPMGDVIRDFEKSDAPQFEGKSKEKRREMAIAAKMSTMKEELKGDQHKIDANKNNRIDAHDFKLLRGKKDMNEDVMMEAITNLLEKDTLSESEYNTIMESPFGVAFQTARREGKAEFEFGGKMYNSRQAGESEADWKAGLAKNAAPPVPVERRADRMPEKPTNVVEPKVEPTNVKQVVPGATPAVSPEGGLVTDRKPWEPSWVQGSSEDKPVEAKPQSGIISLRGKPTGTSSGQVSTNVYDDGGNIVMQRYARQIRGN